MQTVNVTNTNYNQLWIIICLGCINPNFLMFSEDDFIKNKIPKPHSLKLSLEYLQQL